MGNDGTFFRGPSAPEGRDESTRPVTRSCARRASAQALLSSRGGI